MERIGRQQSQVAILKRQESADNPSLLSKVGWIDGWMDGWMDGWKIDGWMDGWIDGWMDGWVDGWMDGWLEEGWMEE